MKDFGMGFFGRRMFGSERMKDFREKWDQMSDSEKLEFMDKKMECFSKYEDPFTVEAIDARCKQWMKMTPEEKEKWVTARKNAHRNRIAMMKEHFGHDHGEFGPFDEEKCGSENNAR